MKNTKQVENKELGDYSIRETLGKGTFGKVKLGIHKQTKQKVAVKILEKSKLKEKDDYERVLREMEIIKQFENENVIGVFEILEDADKYYIIMEFCEEGELFNYIVNKKRLTEEESAFYFYQIINGLEEIHKINIVHRDLKPENLLLTNDKKLKIIDFGLSNFFETKGEFLSTPCGSPCYASPEMVSGKKYNGFMIDIWSTGIILYAMICGYLPFEDPDNEKLFVKILECNLKFPSYVPPLVRDMIKRLLVTDPEHRIKIPDIKKHNFYQLGKVVYQQTFSPKVKHMSSNDKYMAQSVEIPNPNNYLTSPTQQNITNNKLSFSPKSKITPASDITISSPHIEKKGQNLLSFSISPKGISENLKYDLLNTVGYSGYQNYTGFQNSNINFKNATSPKAVHTSVNERNPSEKHKVSGKSYNNNNNINNKRNLSLFNGNLKVHNLLINSSISNNFNISKNFDKSKFKNLSIITNTKNDYINLLDLKNANANKKKNNNYNSTQMNTEVGKSTWQNKKDTLSFNSVDLNTAPNTNTNNNSKNIRLYDLNFINTKRVTLTKDNNLMVNKYLPTINKLKLNRNNYKSGSVESFHNKNNIKNKSGNLYINTDAPGEIYDNNKFKVNELLDFTGNGRMFTSSNANFNVTTSKNNLTITNQNYQKKTSIIKNAKFNFTQTSQTNKTSAVSVEKNMNNTKNKIFNNTFVKIKEKVKDLYYREYLSKVGIKS